MLDALAAALRMGPAERRYLDVLAHGPADGAADAPTAASGRVLEPVAPAVVDLVHRMEPHPTFVKGRRWDVLASGTKKLRHPRFGPLEYSHVVLQMADYPDQTLVTYTAPTS